MILFLVVVMVVAAGIVKLIALPFGGLGAIGVFCAFLLLVVVSACCSSSAAAARRRPGPRRPSSAPRCSAADADSRLTVAAR